MQNFSPKNYNLTFSPDLQKFTYSGSALITIEVFEKTSEITLDIADLQIASCVLAEEKKEKELKFSASDKDLKIKFSPHLKPGLHKISIQFNGVISNFLAGMYKTGYKIKDEQKYFSTTHFEPGDARRVFPCVDHPSYKATFDISVIIDKDLSAVSNMPVVREEKLANNRKLITFDTSPLMSTYLAYLGVGEFEFSSLKYKDITIRAVTTPGKKAYTKFALESTKKFLAFFEEYFDFPYPLPKVDLIAVPDFAAGAMEQWGAITFRENALLYIPGRTAINSQKRIAEVIAHELAHQWFGNLVTMKWWDDLWLNESFATFMAHKALDNFWPEWHIWTDYQTGTIFEGMGLDSLRSSHPIQVQVDHVDQVDELFDEIAYDKGGSILRMLEEYLGEEIFRDGLREYIRKFQYKNAQGSDLWSTLEQVSSKPVSKLMQSFITQTGFPSLFFHLQDATLSVRQERFSFKQQKDIEEWFVPFVIQDDKNITRHLLESKEHTFLLPRVPKFINSNYLYSGFFISEYSNETFTMLGKNLSRLNSIDKIGLIHDLYYNILSGKRTIFDFTNFIERFFAGEKDPTVLGYILSRVASSYMLLDGKKLRDLSANISRRSLKQIKYRPQKNEDPDTVVLRNLSLHILSLLDDEEVTKLGREEFARFLNDEASLHPDIRGTIYGLAVLDKDENYEIILQHYKKSTVHEEKAKFLSSLPRTKNKKFLERSLDFSLSSDVAYSDTIYVFSSISRNPHAKEISIDWLIANWGKLVEKGGGLANMLLRYILKYLIPTFGIGREEEVRIFFNKIKDASLTKTFDQVSEELEVYSKFVKRNKNLA